MKVPLLILRLYAAVAAIVLGVLGRRNKEAPFIRARPRGLPFVHSTIRVARGVWRNWSGELVSRPRRLYCDDAGGPWRSPRTLEELQAIVRDARAEGAVVRAFGSSHSWARLVPTDGYIVDNRFVNATGDRFNVRIEPASADGTRKARATVPPGLLSSELEHWLWEMGYSLPASAFEDCFTVGGMISTATHGVGLDIPTLSDMVVGVTFVDGRGEVRRWTRETATPDELAAVQCGLGCLGLIYDVTFEVEMRSLAPSTALLSPGFRPAGEHSTYRYAAPEVVTTADHPAWDAFVHRANLRMIDAPEILGEEVRCHLAKPCHGFPHPRYPIGGTAAYLRAQYEAAGTWQRFLAVREAVDPDGVFLNDYLRRWFYPPVVEETAHRAARPRRSRPHPNGTASPTAAPASAAHPGA